MQTKRKIVGVCAACLTLTAVVGAGFSAWVLDATVTGEGKGVGVYIEPAKAEIGTIAAIGTNYQLFLDQDGKYDATKGITLKQEGSTSGTYDTKTTAISTTWTLPTAEYNSVLGEGKGAINYYFNIYVKDVMSHYVQVTGGGFTTSTDYSTSYAEGYTMYQAAVTVETSDVREDEDNNTVVTMTYTLPTDANLFQYYDADDTTTGAKKKPTTFEAYAAMVQAITGTTETVVEEQSYSVADTEKLVVFEFQVKLSDATTGA